MTEIEAYIRQQALARGINPDTAVAVARSEGGLSNPTLRSGYRKNGIQEPSYGPFQLLVGGKGTGFPEGMGNDFVNRYGVHPSDPNHWKLGVDFALDNAANKGWGAWYGAKKIGVGRWDGIKTPGRPVPQTQQVAHTPQTVAQPQQVAAVDPQAAVNQGIASLPTVQEVATPQAIPQPLPTTTAQAPTQAASPFSGIFNAMLQSQMQAQQAHQQGIQMAEEPMMRGSDQRPIADKVASTSTTPNAYYDELMKRYG